jgi:tetratricopeptide (TPR) repeat protein
LYNGYAFNNIVSSQDVVEPKEHWSIKAEEFKKERKFEEAVKMLDKVHELEKEEKEDNFWYKKATQYCDIGEYEQAKDALNQDLKINQKNFETFFLMGKILYKLKKYEESLECYNKASEVHTSQHLRNTLKIDQMKNVGKFEEAVKYSDMIYQEKQLGTEYWHQKGMVFFKLKKFNEASSCFEIILEQNHDDPKILYELAKSELGAGNKQKTFEILEKACIIEPRIIEKLRIDKDFEPIAEEKQFRVITGL